MLIISNTFEPCKLARWCGSFGSASPDSSGSESKSPIASLTVIFLPTLLRRKPSISSIVSFLAASLRTDTAITRFLFCGTPKSAAFTTLLRVSYPASRRAFTYSSNNFLPEPPIMPCTFSKTTAKGIISTTKLVNLLTYPLRTSNISLVPLVSAKLLNDWHGGHPTTQNLPPFLRPPARSRSFPDTSMTSAWTGAMPTFSRYSSHRKGSISRAAAGSNPASLNPIDAQPMPANMSTKRRPLSRFTCCVRGTPELIVRP